MRRRSFLAGVAALLASAEARADEDDARPIVVGTSTPGGGFALYGETIARLVNRQVGRELLRARPTRGTAENLDLLRRGEIDAALIQGTSASELFAQGPGTGLRILFAMYPSPGLLAVPARSTIVRLEHAVGRPIVFGVRTSGLVTLGRQVYAGIGIDIDSDMTAIYVHTAAESPRLVLSGSADGLWGAGEGWPGFVELANSPGGARFVGPSPDQVAAIVAKQPLLKAMTVASGAYPGIERPLETVGSVNWILTRADLAPARAIAFVDAMGAVSTELAGALPQAAFSTLANTYASAPSIGLLHAALEMRRLR